jgi:glycosidase
LRLAIPLIPFLCGGLAVDAHVHSTGKTQEPVSWRCIPISRGLGLADIVVSTSDPTIERLAVALEQPGNAGVARIPLTRAAHGSDTWTARVFGATPNGGTVGFRLIIRRPNSPVEELGPFRAEISPAFETPDWAKGAVWYSIFPERFRNANPANDPAGPDTFPADWFADWGTVGPAEFEAYRAAGGKRREALAEVTRRRRYGGDLHGIVDRLDYLASLGVTGVYLCPVFQAPSADKYDAADYRHVDQSLGGPSSRPSGTPAETPGPATWTWTEADRYLVETLLPEARRRGIRVILDGVWNHTGTGFWAFRDVVRHGARSAYAGWYEVEFTGSAGALEAWRAWDGRNGRLPRFARTPDGDLHPGVKAHLFDITRRWMDPDADTDPRDGVDGWRLDVAAEIGAPFWHDWRRHVKSINPDAYLVGEVWHHAREHLDGRAFDAQMNYPFARAVVDWLRGTTDSAELAAALDALNDVPPQVRLVQMNLLGSHDTQRLASALANPDAPFDSGGAPGQTRYSRAQPGPEVYDLVVLGAALQVTYAGAPMIYYGDELGMYGGKDPDCRKPVPWPDLPREREARDNRIVPGLPDRFRSWFTLRSDPVLGPILRYGSVAPIPGTGERVFAFARALNGQRVTVVLNAGQTPYDAAAVAAGARRVPADVGAVVAPRAAALWFAEVSAD